MTVKANLDGTNGDISITENDKHLITIKTGKIKNTYKSFPAEDYMYSAQRIAEQLRIVVHQAEKKVDEGYCRIRKQMQDNGICEHDIEAAIELMKGIRGEEAYGT